MFFGNFPFKVKTGVRRMAPPPLTFPPQAPPANKPAVSIGWGFFAISGNLTMWPLPGRLAVFKKLGKKGPILLKIASERRISPKDSKS